MKDDQMPDIKLSVDIHHSIITNQIQTWNNTLLGKLQSYISIILGISFKTKL